MAQREDTGTEENKRRPEEGTGGFQEDANRKSLQIAAQKGETYQGETSLKQALQCNRARAHRILANMGHITEKWENIEGAVTHRSVVLSGVDPIQPPTTRE